MRVALVTESFLPHMNGVTGSVLRVLDHLRLRGHDALVIAPGVRDTPATASGFPVKAHASMPMPGYPQVRLCLTPDFLLAGELDAFAPDVVHLASPLVLGHEAAQAAASLGVPSVAIYQTEVTSYAARYGVPQIESLLWRRLRTTHNLAARTLVPSSFSAAQLSEHGIERIHRWGRGVDLDRFHPRRRDDAWRASLAPNGETIVGYIGRLAPEKSVEHLCALVDLPRVKLVVAGAGPSEPELRRLLPQASFLGHLAGDDLGLVMASLDVFVHTGELETFGQTLQEAHAAGVPVVAPRRGGPVDLVREGLDGLLYTPGDPSDLRRAVTHLVDADARAALAAASRPAVADRSWEGVCDELLGHYEAAIQGRP